MDSTSYQSTRDAITGKLEEDDANQLAHLRLAEASKRKKKIGSSVDATDSDQTVFCLEVEKNISRIFLLESFVTYLRSYKISQQKNFDFKIFFDFNTEQCY